MAKRTGIMLAYGFDERRLTRFHKPYLLQPKLEGDRRRAVLDSSMKHYHLLTSSAAISKATPCINEELDQRFLKARIELDGEAYNHGMPHELIHGIASRTVLLHEEHNLLEFHIFDIVSQKDQHFRLLTLKAMELQGYFDSPHLVRVPYKEATCLEEVIEYYEEQVEAGYEGIIIRDPRAPYVRRKAVTMMKAKPSVSDDFEVIGYKQEYDINGQPKESLGAITCRTDDGEEFDCGSGFKRNTGKAQHQREFLWRIRQDLIGRRAKIRFQSYTTARKVPKMLRFVDWV